MLAAGASISKVLLSFFGGDMEGARWQHIVARMVECGELATGVLHSGPIRHNDATERTTLAWVIMVLSTVRRKGSRLVAQDRELYQGAMAARLGVSTRAIQRRRRVAQEAGVIQRHQPPSTSADALMPRRGDWSYLEHLPVTALPPVLMQRLRVQWREISPPGPSSAPSPAPVTPPPAPSSGAPRGGAPPPLAPDDSTLSYAQLVLQNLRERAKQPTR